MMKNYMLRLCLFILLFCLGVFFGIDIAGKGMERVYGPITDEHAASGLQSLAKEHTEAPQSAGAAETSANVPDHAGYAAPVVQDAAAGQLGSKDALSELETGRIGYMAQGAGEFLQGLAQGIVDMILSLFDGLFVS